MSQPINEALWQQLTQDVMTEMRAWRVEHPKATLREMETELDARLSRLRARLLADLALTSRPPIGPIHPSLSTRPAPIVVSPCSYAAVIRGPSKPTAGRT